MTETSDTIASGSGENLTTDESVIRVVDLQKYFLAKLGLWESIKGKKVVIRALDGVSLEIKKGEIFGLAGESGCGKTTLLRLIAGLIEPDSGEIYIGDKLVGASPTLTIAKPR